MSNANLKSVSKEAETGNRPQTPVPTRAFSPARSRTPDDGGAPSPEMHDRVRRMLQDLDTPLDGAPGQPAPWTRQTGSARREKDELRRARRAARKVFKVSPSRSARQRATAMLTAGAVGLAAFTGPSALRLGADDGATSHLTRGDDATQTRIHASRIATSEQFKRALVQEEGVRQVVYRDVAGYPTVGVGHLIEPRDDLRIGDRVSRQRVLDFLEADIAEAERHVRDLVGVLPLFQHEFDALVDLVYNVGRGNVSAAESPRLNAAIDAADYQRIASELDYTHAAGRVARGLEFRSERRESIFLDASYQDPRETRSARSDV